MSFITVAGSKLAVSVALPATYTEAGYAALTYIDIGEITDVGGVLGRQYNKATHAPVGSAQQTVKKASYTLPDAAFVCAWDENDAGQNAIEAAEKTNDILAFVLTKQDGAKRYFTAQVMSFTETSGTVDNVVHGNFTLLRQTDSILVAAAP